MDSAVNSDFEEIFEHLFSSPCCWSAFKIFHFLFDAFEKVKETHNKMLRLTKNKNYEFHRIRRPDEEMKFCIALDKEAIKCELWPEDEEGRKWMAVLGDKFFEFLEKATEHLRFNVVDNLVPNSVVSLMKLIRDLSTHPEVGMALNWGNVVQVGNKVKWELDKLLFVQWWTSKFPKLPTFVWNAFKHRSGTLEEAYYQGSLDFSEMNDFHTPLEFLNGLQEACKDQTKAGHVKGPFKMSAKEGSPFTVELRPLDADLLGRVLNGNLVVQIVADRGQMCFSWSTKCDNNKSLWFSLPPGGQPGINVEEVNYIFTNNFKKETFILDRWALNTQKVVVFMGADSIDKVVSQCSNSHRFNELSIKWGKLDEYSEKGLQICVQGRKFPFANLSTKERIQYENIFCKLNGEMLKDFLRNQEIELVDKFIFPAQTGAYIQRRVCNRAIVKSTFFSNIPLNDIFIIVSSSLDEQQEIKRFARSISKNYVFPELRLEAHHTRVLVVEDIINDFSSEFMKFKGLEGFNIHFFKFIGNGMYKWLESTGKIFELEQPSESSTDSNIRIMEEHEFLDSLEIEPYKNEKLVVISNPAATGKTEFGKNVSTELKRDDNKTVLIISMVQFMNILEEKVGSASIENIGWDTLKDKVMENLAELIGTKGFKTEMLVYLFRCKGVINLEIFLDGLDEVKPSLTALAFQTILALHSEMPSARIWITLRIHLLGSVVNKFGRLGYTLDSNQSDIGRITKIRFNTSTPTRLVNPAYPTRSMTI